MSISEFLQRNYRHINARETLAAAESYREHLETGGKMLISLAGAMSTAEIGISLAPLIRSGKVHAISCTAANLEEDLYNLLAHDDYSIVPHYRELSPADGLKLRNDGFNRVTDTCIPETVIRDVEADPAAKSQAEFDRCLANQIGVTDIAEMRFNGFYAAFLGATTSYPVNVLVACQCAGRGVGVGRLAVVDVADAVDNGDGLLAMG